MSVYFPYRLYPSRGMAGKIWLKMAEFLLSNIVYINETAWESCSLDSWSKEAETASKGMGTDMP